MSSNYEQFRSAFSAHLMDRLPVGLLHDVLQALDLTAADYEITKTNTDIIVYGGMPEIVKTYAAALAVEQTATSTIKGYISILRAFFEAVNKPFNAITTNDIRVYMYRYQQEHSIAKSTLEHIRIVINGFYSWLVDEEIMERNPARKIRPIDVPEPDRHAMTPLELEYIRKCCTTPREKALVDFLFSTGCRVSECAAVKMEDIDWNIRSVRIRHGKGDKARTVYFNPEAEVSLRDYLSDKKHPSEYLFSRSRAPYGKVTSKALQDEIKHIRDRASDHLQTHITPHVFRHTMATSALRNGMRVEQVQQLLGHASLDTTMRYAKQDQNDVRASHQKYVS